MASVFKYFKQSIKPNTRTGDGLHLSVAMQCEVKTFAALDMMQAASAKQLGFEVVTI